MLKISNITKLFGGHTALSDVNFDLESGKTLGIIGQNGAGKTTIFRLILGFADPDRGEIKWTYKKNGDFFDTVGYLPEERGLNLKRTIDEQLQFFGALKGMTSAEVNEGMDYWFNKFNVTATKKQKIGSLSKGNKQKIQLICSIIHHPDFLILDEPYSGLDPVNASLLSDGISKLKEDGTTIIFSSHNMDNVEHISDNLVMLNKGEVVLNGSISEIKNSFGNTNILVENKPGLKVLLAKNPDVLSLSEKKDNTLKIRISHEKAGKDIFSLATADGYTNHFSQSPPTLEEIFKIKAGNLI